MASEQINQAIATARELIAAGKKVAAEGDVIIAQRRLVSRHWDCRGTRPVPKPQPKLDPPEYVLTSTDYDNVKAVVTMMKLIKIGKSASLRAAAYRDAGMRIEELRQNRNEAQWHDILHRECGLSPRRAYELMAIATRSKPFDQLRSKTSDQVETHMEKAAA
jgi:hypothetical protein